MIHSLPDEGTDNAAEGGQAPQSAMVEPANAMKRRRLELNDPEVEISNNEGAVSVLKKARGMLEDKGVRFVPAITDAHRECKEFLRNLKDQEPEHWMALSEVVNEVTGMETWDELSDLPFIVEAPILGIVSTSGAEKDSPTTADPATNQRRLELSDPEKEELRDLCFGLGFAETEAIRVGSVLEAVREMIENKDARFVSSISKSRSEYEEFLKKAQEGEPESWKALVKAVVEGITKDNWDELLNLPFVIEAPVSDAEQADPGTNIRRLEVNDEIREEMMKECAVFSKAGENASHMAGLLRAARIPLKSQDIHLVTEIDSTSYSECKQFLTEMKDNEPENWQALCEAVSEGLKTNNWDELVNLPFIIRVSLLDDSDAKDVNASSLDLPPSDEAAGKYPQLKLNEPHMERLRRDYRQGPEGTDVLDINFVLDYSKHLTEQGPFSTPDPNRNILVYFGRLRTMKDNEPERWKALVEAADEAVETASLYKFLNLQSMVKGIYWKK